jgi:3-methylfumaryl-CoA hydratase
MHLNNRTDVSPIGALMAVEASHQTYTHTEHCSAMTVRRVAAMLDLPLDGFVDGAMLPRGWHFTLMGADTPRSMLRADGFPGLGAPLPDLGLPRLLQGGRSVAYHRDIPIGATVTRTSSVANVTEKTNASGRMAIVKMAHSLTLQSESAPAITETQTYLLLPAQAAQKTSISEPVSISARHMKGVLPDDTLLFQYSALCFNSHKIHLDRAYARDVEGFPDLVMNGGLTTLFLTEFARQEIGLQLTSFAMKNVAPLFCGRAATLAADCSEGKWSLKAYDESGRVAAEMEADAHEL